MQKIFNFLIDIYDKKENQIKNIITTNSWYNLLIYLNNFDIY
jgi:hypothetical protein